MSDSTLPHASGANIAIISALFATLMAISDFSPQHEQEQEKKLVAESTGYDWLAAKDEMKEKLVEAVRPRSLTWDQAMNQVGAEYVVQAVDEYYQSTDNLNEKCGSIILDEVRRLNKQARAANDIYQLQEAVKQIERDQR